MSQLTPDFKHHILTQYLPSSHDNSFSALAARHDVKGGKRTIQRWYARWDGTSASLEHKQGAGRPHLLSSAEINDNIRTPIRNRNRAHRPVHYTDLLHPPEREQERMCPFQQFDAMARRFCELVIGPRVDEQQRRVSTQRYKYQLGRCCAQCIELTLLDFVFCFPALSVSVSSELCDSIAELRRRIQQVDADHVLFLDEDPFKVSEAPSHNLVFPGESVNIDVDDNFPYITKYDMISCCTHKEVPPPKLFVHTERADSGVKEINRKLRIKHVQDILAQACKALGQYPLYSVLDRASIHNEQNVLETVHESGFGTCPPKQL
jgi:hypothetical protein